MAGMLMDHTLHDVLQVKLQLFKSMLFNFFLFREKMLSFQLFYFTFVFLMLGSKLPEFLTRLQQMRFDVCLL